MTKVVLLRHGESEWNNWGTLKRRNGQLRPLPISSGGELEHRCSSPRKFIFLEAAYRVFEWRYKRRI
jgi:hypothetical protein